MAGHPTTVDPGWLANADKLASLKTLYQDPSMRFEGGRAVHGDGTPVVAQRNPDNPGASDVVFHRPESGGTPAQDYLVEPDGSYQPVKVTPNIDQTRDPFIEPSGPGVFPAGYARGADGRFHPVDKNGNQIGPAPIGDKPGETPWNAVPEGYKVYDPATGQFRDPTKQETRPRLDNEQDPSRIGSQPPAPQAPPPEITPELPKVTPPTIEELKKYMGDNGIELPPNATQDQVNAKLGTLMSRMKPGAPNHWYPKLHPEFPWFAQTPENKKNVEKLSAHVDPADGKVGSANDRSFAVDPSDAWWYPNAKLKPGTHYQGGADINPLTGTHEAVDAYRKAVADPADELGKFLGNGLATHTERWVRMLATKAGVADSSKFLTGLTSGATTNGKLGDLGDAVKATGVAAQDQWHLFRHSLQGNRDTFANCFDTSGGVGSIMVKPSSTSTAFSSPAPDSSKVTAAAKKAEDAFPSHPVKQVGFHDFNTKPQEKTPTTPMSATPGSAPPMSSTPGLPGSTPGSTPGTQSPNSKADALRDLANALNGQQPSSGMPSMPSSGMPSSGMPNMGNMPNMGANPDSGMDPMADQDEDDPNDKRKDQLDALLAPNDEQTEAPVVVGTGPLRPGDPVRPNQLGADGQKLDKDGDGLMDDDAVAPGPDSEMIPFSLTSSDGSELPMSLRDPRLGEMMLNMTDAGSQGQSLSVLDAAARSGMAMPDHGERINPMDIQPGDAVVGKGEGLYVGDAKVLTGDGSVVPLADVLELRPPDKGVFRLPTPDMDYIGAGPDGYHPPPEPPAYDPNWASSVPEPPAFSPEPEGQTPGSAPPPPSPDAGLTSFAEPATVGAPGEPQRVEFNFTPPPE